MIWGAKMLLKINKKIIENLDAFLTPFWRKSCGICGGGDSPLAARNSEFAY